MSATGNLTNLAVTATSAAALEAAGLLINGLNAALANGGRDSNCKFYYDRAAGGSIVRVAARAVAGGAVAHLKDLADNKFRMVSPDGAPRRQEAGEWLERELAAQKEERRLYGKMEVAEGKYVFALDDWGCVSPDALMLAVRTSEPVTITQSYPAYARGADGKPQRLKSTVTSNTLVWYDTTAIISINSDKNLIATRVQGRDYSRKELVSNGDIKFSVSGQITSGLPDVYPAKEVQKFLKVMRYKGVVRVNNQLLDQFGITHIVVTDFSLSSKEGGKSVQGYSFSGIGLQPEREASITKDTVVIRSADEREAAQESQDGLLEAVSRAGVDIFTQATALASGYLNDAL